MRISTTIIRQKMSRLEGILNAIEKVSGCVDSLKNTGDAKIESSTGRGCHMSGRFKTDVIEVLETYVAEQAQAAEMVIKELYETL